jgi:hypothetical protein
MRLAHYFLPYYFYRRTPLKTPSSSSSVSPVDAVITWVDGADPVHADKLNAYLESLGGKSPRSASKARFHSAGEIDYCVTSILKFAPWVRTIFIVTDNQTPEIVGKLIGTAFEGRVKVVDHQVLFREYQQCLPTFNSMAITSLLWKIPGLAEKFIYLNDDFVLLRAVQSTDFFSENGVVLRGSWQQQPNASVVHKTIRTIKNIFRSHNKKTRVSYWELQQHCGELLGFNKRYFRLPHVPHPWRLSSWQRLFGELPDALEVNIHARLRGGEQYVPESLSAHFELKNETANINNLRTNVQLKPAEQPYWRIWLKLKLADRNENSVFSCIQSIEMASATKQKLIFSWLDKRIGSVDELCNKKPEVDANI